MLFVDIKTKPQQENNLIHVSYSIKSKQSSLNISGAFSVPIRQNPKYRNLYVMCHRQAEPNLTILDKEVLTQLRNYLNNENLSKVTCRDINKYFVNFVVNSKLIDQWFEKFDKKGISKPKDISDQTKYGWTTDTLF